MIRPFQILAVILLGVAVFFWYREESDWAFAAGVCSAAAYFLSMRFQMKERVRQADADEAGEDEAYAEEAVPEDQ